MSVETQSFSSSIKLFVHALLPSSVSVIIGFILACVIIGVHVLFITLNGDTRPIILSGEAYNSYAANVLDPLLRLTNSNTLNNGINIFLWGLFGWALYAVVSYIVSSLSELNKAHHEVRIAGGVVVQSPMDRPFLLALGWRLIIAITVIIYSVFVLSVLHYVFAHDYLLLSGMRPLSIPVDVLKSIIIIMLVLHGYLILLRLYMKRTRVFGEILY